MSREKTVAREDDGETVVGAENRLQELKEERDRQAEKSMESKEAENPPSVQKGIVRDVERTRNSRLRLTVETEYDSFELSMNLPQNEYSLDSELVRLLEWKGVEDGRVGDLLDKSVYVDMRSYGSPQLLVPDSLSPFDRAKSHFRGRFSKPIDFVVDMFDFDSDSPTDNYLSISMLSAIPSMLLLFALAGSMSLVAGVVTLFVLVPFASLVVGPAFFVVGLASYVRIRDWWKSRYHEL